MPGFMDMFTGGTYGAGAPMGAGSNPIGPQPVGQGTVLAPQQQPGPMIGGYNPPGLEQYMNPVQGQNTAPINALAQGFMQGLTGAPGGAPGGLYGGIGNFAGGILNQQSGGLGSALSGNQPLGQRFTGQGPQVANAAGSHSLKAGAIIGALAGMCLHPDTPIETPNGDMPIRHLKGGDLVKSGDALGVVVATVTCQAPTDHFFVAVNGPRGTFFVTPSHPLPNGDPVDTIATQDHLEFEDTTHDILVESPTGTYFSQGIELGSTLDARHKKAS